MSKSRNRLRKRPRKCLPRKLGIDFGTTFTVCFRGEKAVEIDHGVRVYHTQVGVKGDRYFLLPRSTRATLVKWLKRTLGRSREDGRLESDIQNVPFAKICDDGVVFDIDGKRHLPEEFYAFLLAKIKEAAEKEAPVEGCVIGVPAYHDFKQRQRLRDAARIAGLKDVTLVDEQVAAMVDYVVSNPEAPLNKEITVVIDPGGGTIDISAVYYSHTKTDKCFVIKATAGDKCTGGIDIDRGLMEFVLDKAKPKFRFDDNVLLDECETHKKALSAGESAAITIYSLDGREEQTVEVSRADFDRICQPVAKVLDTSLKDLSDLPTMDLDSVKNVLLVGGSSSLPCVVDACKKWLPTASILRSIGSEAVARGCAILADDPSIRFIQTLPRRVGIRAHEGSSGPIHLATILHRNQQLPMTKFRDFETKRENEEEIEISIWEGDNEDIALATPLDTMRIADIPPGPAGQRIKVKMHIPELGIINVTATLGDTTKSLTVIPKGGLAEDVLEDLRLRTENRLKGRPVTERRTDVTDLAMRPAVTDADNSYVNRAVGPTDTGSPPASPLTECSATPHLSDAESWVEIQVEAPTSKALGDANKKRKRKRKKMGW